MPGPTVRNTKRGLVTTRKRGRVIQPSAPPGRRVTPVSPSRALIATAPVHGRPTRERRAQRVASALQRVQRAYSTPKGVTGPGISKGESKFYSTLAKKTGLSPRVLAAQGTQEGGADQDYNILNIGRTDSGDLGLTADKRFQKPKSAATLTAKFLKGKEFGAAPSIQQIIPKAKGKSDAEQVRVIAGSHWATDPRYAQGISSILPSVKSTGKTKPAKKDLKTLHKAGVPVPISGSKNGKVGQPAPTIKPKQAKQFKTIEKRANSVAGTPYVWGGGHGGGDPKAGLDCSGAVSYALGLKTPLTSGQMGSVLKPGPGAVTVYYNEGHTFMKIGNKFWGTSVGDSGSGGLGEHPAPSGSYLSQYSVGHVPGLGKDAAAALGVKLSKGGSASATPGGGGSTSASFSHGTIKMAPGFSNHPIKAVNKVAERKKKLGRVRAAYADDTSEPTAGTSAIAARHDKPVV